MGNAIPHRPTLRSEMQHYKELPLSSITKLIKRFDTLQQQQQQSSSSSSAFGFGITHEMFIALFKLDASSPATTQLWQAWDTDMNGVTDILEIFSSLLLISHGSFESKVNALFKLYDFDENQVLTCEECGICIRTTVEGVRKVCGNTVDTTNAAAASSDDQSQQSSTTSSLTAHELTRLSNKLFLTISTGSRSITHTQFMYYVLSTPSIISLICSFGTTTNLDEVRKKFVELNMEEKAAVKIQQAFKTYQMSLVHSGKKNSAAVVNGKVINTDMSRVTGDISNHATPNASAAGANASRSPLRLHPHRRAEDPNYASHHPSASSHPPFEFNLLAVKRAKYIFDSIDTDHSGSISASELSRTISRTQSDSQPQTVQAILSAFASLDRDRSGTLTFNEMLHILYPQAKVADIKRVIREVNRSSNDPPLSSAPDNDVHNPPISRSIIIALQQWFSTHDTDFDGKIRLKDAVAALKKDDVFKQYLDGYTLSVKLGDKLVGFKTLLNELFATQYSHQQYSLIVQWYKLNGPVHQLDAKQQQELETLFALYDTKGEGFISMMEMKQHFMDSKLGFDQEHAKELFAQYDTNGDQRVDLVEFKRFYRQVWASSAAGRRRNGQEATD